MNSNQILYPVFAQVALTFLVLFTLMILRLLAVLSKRVNLSYFKTFTGPNANFESPLMIHASRNYTNLFESPMLFFAVAILFYVTQSADDLAIKLAWVYVAARGVHSLVHLTFNDVNTRFAAFLVSQIVLISLWVRLAMHLM